MTSPLKFMGKIVAVIVAAGAGKRFGGLKQHSLLGGESVLERTLAAFQKHPEVDEILPVLENPEAWSSKAGRFPKISRLVKGGRERQDSVAAGFFSIRDLNIEGPKDREQSSHDIILIHDGARPLVEGRLISRVIEGTRRYGAVCPGIPVEDTIKRVLDGRILHTEDRNGLVRVQTPQGFWAGILKRALDKFSEDGYYGTDEASLVERMGLPVHIVEGDRRNVKITTPLDLKIAEALLEA